MASYYYYDGYIIIGELRAVEVMLDMLRQQTSFSETSKKNWSNFLKWNFGTLALHT